MSVGPTDRIYAATDAGVLARGNQRWVICGLLFAATAINYVDRQIIGVLKPVLQTELSWTEVDYGNIVLCFQAAYALGYICFGRVVDRIGARWGYALAVAVWTVAHVAHAATRSLTGFMLVRFGLGLGESGNFPAGLAAVAEWFPKRERALATGIFNAGANVGAIVTPLIVPIITVTLGWRAAFVLTGFLSLAWLLAWLWLYRRPTEKPSLSAAELDYIRSDPPDPPMVISWWRLLRVRETWVYAIGKFLIDPVWWMFLFWLPDFFAKRHHLDLLSFGPPLVAVYLLSDVGSIAGGWLSSALMKRGWSINAARKTALLASALVVLPVTCAVMVDNLWLAVGILGLAAAGHQAFSANLYTLPSDLFPRRAVGSVVGLGGTAGAIGGMLMAKYAGWVLESVGSYTPIFIVAGFVYLLALLVVHLGSPDYGAARID
jgi:ACS family hexuronate transporter-like MFS transporter